MEKLTCQDCVHYVQYYVKGADKFRKIECGHCNKTKGNGRYRIPNKLCEHYRVISEGEMKNNRTKAIKCTLNGIHERLNELKEVLNAE